MAEFDLKPKNIVQGSGRSQSFQEEREPVGIGNNVSYQMENKTMILLNPLL